MDTLMSAIELIRPSRDISMFSGAVVGLCLAILLVLPVALFAQEVDQAELKDRFFQPLSDDQVTQLLTTIDRSQQLTSVELGAKYKWGYIPPDRTPSFSLAQWWDKLNARERRRVRLEWFDDHYQELNVERAARELEMRDRLSELYRELSRDVGPGEVQFEPVSFPNESLDVDTGQQESLPESYRKYQTSSGEDIVEQPGQPSQPPSSTEEDRPERKSTAQPSPDEQTDAEAQESTDDGTKQPSPGVTTDTGPSESTKPDWTKSLDLEQGTVVFERTGNKINVIKRNRRTDTHLRDGPDYEFPMRPSRSGKSVDITPRLRYDDEGASPAIR